MFCWNVVDDILELAQHHQYQDVTLVCNDGKMTCNSIVLALSFPTIRKALNSLPYTDLDENITIMCLDVDLEEIKQFLNNISNQTEEFSSCKDLVDLLGQEQSGFEIKVEIHDDLKKEESISTSNIEEDMDNDVHIKESLKSIDEYEDLDELIDLHDPLKTDENFDQDPTSNNQNEKSDRKKKMRKAPSKIPVARK